MVRPSHRAKLYVFGVVAAVRADAVIYGTLVAYLLAGAAYVISKSGIMFGAFDIYARTCVITYGLLLPFVALVTGISRITHRLDRRRWLAYRYMFGPRRVARFLAGTLLMLAVLLPFESMFASVKSAFSDSGFPYDKIAADIDKAIHFGHAPVKYIFSIAKNDGLLRVIEFNYDVVWFIVCFGILYWVAISPKADGIRLRYFASFFLVWVIVGNVVAGLFPAAGPAFYGLVTGDTARFSKLQAFLDSTAGSFSSASDAQHYLWYLHQNGISGFGSGISAFPSMHVALIAMNAMFMAERSRLLGAVAAVYVVFIMVSSVYLGWHYAIDGYMALILSTIIYWTVKRVMPAIGAAGREQAWRPAGAGAITAAPAE